MENFTSTAKIVRMMAAEPVRAKRLQIDSITVGLRNTFFGSTVNKAIENKLFNSYTASHKFN